VNICRGSLFTGVVFLPAMTSAAADTESDDRCASCGIAAVDDLELKKCGGCNLVRYCSVTCQKEHRPQHKKECKKRAAELRDEILFKQPEGSHYGDCAVCLLPLPIAISVATKRFSMNTCCCKLICHGCDHANQNREEEEMLKHTCPFCRQPRPKTMEEAELQLMKRVEVNDSVAMRQFGLHFHEQGDYDTAIKYITMAAGLGDEGAHYQLSNMYGPMAGDFVEKDKEKELFHLEQAAIRGNIYARYNLGCCEKSNGRYERAVKHFIIAASNGFDNSLQMLRKLYAEGKVKKEDFAAALRAHQAAVEETKSPHRDAAEVARRNDENHWHNTQTRALQLRIAKG